MGRVLWSLFWALLLVAIGVGIGFGVYNRLPKEVQEFIVAHTTEQGQTAYVTSTPRSTSTPTPTATPTVRGKPTSTPTPTRRPTATLTPTPLSFTHRKLPISGASGQVILVNNNEAFDPTWEQLVSFLLEDGTDEQIYLGGFRVCADFATQLHNNAEAAGIKAAFVSIGLQDNPGGHALNAFQVVDRGLVYIDCTGTEIQPVTFEEWLSNQETPLERDKVAYAAVGKEYGLVSVNVAHATDYEFYESYVQQWEGYDQQLTLYNTKADAYNKALAGRVVIADPGEYAKLREMYDELEAMRAELETLRVKLGGHRWEPLGIVTDIELYW